MSNVGQHAVALGACLSFTCLKETARHEERVCPVLVDTPLHTIGVEVAGTDGLLAASLGHPDLPSVVASWMEDDEVKWVVPSMCLVDCLERAPPHLDHDISAILIGVGLENSHLGVILAAVGFVTGRVVPPRVRGSRTVAGRGRRTSVGVDDNLGLRLVAARTLVRLRGGPKE